MVRKTKEDALRTRTQLIDAAEIVFYEKGYARASLEDVAQQAGVTRGAIYWHFKNKADLLQAMLDRVLLLEEMLAGTQEDKSPDEADPLDILRRRAIRILKQTATNPRRRRVFTILFHRCELSNDNRSLEQRHQNSLARCISDFENLLIQAQQRGQVPANLDIQQAAVAIPSYISGLIGSWLLLPSAFDLAGRAEDFVNAMIEMLLYSNSMQTSLKSA